MENLCFPQHSHELILTAHRPGYIGTSSKITGFLADKNCYLTDLQQFDDIFSNRFYIRCTFFRNNETSPPIDSLREHFLKIAKEENMEWNFHDCNTKIRAVIMVSKLDHCLNDLLYRQKTGESLITEKIPTSPHTLILFRT
jgi:formyltetrahydrofolate deformylase